MPIYNVKKKIHVIVGVSDILKYKRFLDQVLFTVSRLELNPNYDPYSNSKGADLALLKLNQKVDLTDSINMNSLVIEPIC